jgi:hypothetical protein
MAKGSIVIEGNAAYLPEGKAMVYMADDEKDFFRNKKAMPTIPRNSRELVFKDVISWGDGNRMPLEILKKIKEEPSIAPIIKWKTNMAVRRGVVPMQVIDYDDNGQEVLRPIKDVKIQEFFRDKRFNRWYLESFLDFYTFQNTGTELILSKDRSRVTQLCHQEVMFSRFEKRGEDGRIRNVVLSGDFPSVGDNDLYQTPSWWGYVVSGWYDIRKMIATAKRALMKNRMLVLYMIEIPSNYWGTQYSDWDTKTKDEKKAIKKTKLEEINAFLTDVENHGKGLMAEFSVDQNGKIVSPGWKITPIGDKAKEGMYLDDFQESTALMFYAFNVDPTLTGFSSKDIGSRSGGSDKREALLIYEELIQPERSLVLEPAMFKAQYDGWTDKYEGFRLAHVDKILTTLDKGKGTEKIVG